MLDHVALGNTFQVVHAARKWQRNKIFILDVISDYNVRFLWRRVENTRNTGGHEGSVGEAIELDGIRLQFRAGTSAHNEREENVVKQHN